MGDSDKLHLGFLVEVTQGDPLEYKADVLAVKDAPYPGGVDRAVRDRLKKAGYIPSGQHLTEDSYTLWPGKGIAHARQVLVVGTVAIIDLRYTRLRKLGRRYLEALWENGADASHLATIPGVRAGFLIDETEAFRSLLLGMADAYELGHYPPALRRITFVEQNKKRVPLWQETLQKFLLEEPPTSLQKQAAESLGAVMAGPESFELEYRGPEADETTPHVFVAMPFKTDYDDQFYLAIQPVVTEMGLLCERMDLDTFTGDIMDRMFDRIRTARLMIALLDGENPNVYLEVGYAMCAGTPTVLAAHKKEPLPFDVRSQRVLIYEKIHQLKDMLKAELKRLLG